MIRKYIKNPQQFEAEQFLGLNASHEENGLVNRIGIEEDVSGEFASSRCPKSDITGQYGIIKTKLGYEKICPGNYVVMDNRGGIESLPEYLFKERYSEV
jgi:hypothetical protein